MIFALSAIAGPPAFDHSHAQLGAFLEGAVSEQGVDYELLSTRRALLSTYLEGLAEADLSVFAPEQELAFWVNAYNAHTLALILDHRPVGSIMEIDDGNPWDKRIFRVAGADVTLNRMEHGHARPLGDGRVHAVVNCASRGCPPLPPTPITAEGLDGQLDEAARRWARTNGYLRTGNEVAINNIFTWYAEDFADASQGDLPGVEGAHENALWFLSRYVDEAEGKKLTSGTVTTSLLPYDWALNEKEKP